MSINSRSLDKTRRNLTAMLKCSLILSKVFTNLTSKEYNNELIYDSVMVLGIAIISLHSINNGFLQPTRSVYCAIRSDSLTVININPLNPELNPICYLLALLGAHHFLHVSRIRVISLTLRRLMSYIYGAPILDVSRSHTTTRHSR